MVQSSQETSFQPPIMVCISVIMTQLHVKIHCEPLCATSMYCLYSPVLLTCGQGTHFDNCFKPYPTLNQFLWFGILKHLQISEYCLKNTIFKKDLKAPENFGIFWTLGYGLA